MYLHVGSDQLVPLADIVAVLDAEILSHSPETRQLYLRLRSEGAVRGVDSHWRRSLVLWDDGVAGGLVESLVSSMTLWARAEQKVSDLPIKPRDTI